MRKTVLKVLLVLLAFVVAGPAALAQQVTLTYWQGWLAPEHQKTEVEIVEEFMRRNPDIRVDFAHMNNPGEQVKVAYAGGVLADVVVSSRDDFPDWQGIGAFMDLTHFLEKEAAFKDEFIPQLLELFQVDGRQYGLPYSANGRGLFSYEVDPLLEAGLGEPGLEPWSWSEFVENGKKLTRYDGFEMTQAAFGVDRTPMSVWTWFWSNGTDIFNEDFTEINSSPAFMETLEFLRSLIHEHDIAPVPGVSVPKVVIGSGVGPWAFVPWKQRYEEGGPQRKLMWQPYNGTPQRVAMVGGSGLQIASTTKHPEEAWRLLSYLTSEEVQWKRYMEGYGTSSLRNNLVRASQMTDGPVPEPQDIYWESFSYGFVQPSFPLYRRWSSIWNNYTQQVLLGELSVNAAVEHIVGETEALFAAE